VFELAAFLKSHETESPPRLVIRPQLMASATLGRVFGSASNYFLQILIPDFDGILLVALTVYWSCWLCSVYTFYWQEVMKADALFSTFSMAKLEATCCSINHRASDGSILPCDRKVLISCIRKWFGSEANFEHVVKSSVRNHFIAKLTGIPFGFAWIVGSAIPTLWGQVDFAAARFNGDDIWMGFAQLVQIIPWMCLVNPIGHILVSSTSRCLLPRVSPGVSFAATFLVSLATNVVFFLILGACYQMFSNPLLAVTLWSAALSTILAGVVAVRWRMNQSAPRF